MHLIKKPTKTT